jgi:TonB-linked SusC/RagA family outer membrane protein
MKNINIFVLITMFIFCLPINIAAKQNVGQIQGINQQDSLRTITGLLTESSGDPIIGATVMVKGTNRGTTTNENGRYTIRIADGETIAYRYIGYNTEERTIKKGVRIINIQMVASSVNLSDVVVVGYGQQKKESVVASISSIGSDELNIANRSLTNSIAGKISGVIAVTRTGEPGWDDAQFWIRGMSSYAGGTDPLVLVDGIPRSMDNIDVDEIESFTVLKDAAATAVYGAEGANGVILVTSKRGKAQKTAVNLTAEHGFDTPMRLPSLMNSYEYLNLYNEATWNDQGNPLVGFQQPTSDEILEKYRTGADTDLYPSVNWMDMLKKHTQSSRYTINFRGGGEKVHFFVSGSYYNADGIYKNNPMKQYDSNVDIKRYNLRSNVDFNLSKTTLMSVDMSEQYFTKTAPITTADKLFTIMTVFPVHVIPMIYSDGTASEHPNADASYNRANPYNLLNFKGYDKSWSATVQSKISLEQKLDFITKGLSVKGCVSFDAYSEQFINREMTAHSYYATGRDSNGKLIKKTINEGSALGNPTSGSSGGNKSIYIETSLNYKRTFGKNDLTGLLLYNQKETQYQNKSGLELLPYRKQNVVARTTYGYDNRYMLEASFGVTGSENFAAGHRWGFFPAVGAAWYISHEKFMASILPTINKLKLRASYGRTGNDDLSSSLSRFPYQASLNESGGGYNLGITAAEGGSATNWYGNGIIENTAASPHLSWEIEDEQNYGIDLGLFNGRIDMSTDYFYYRRHNILLQRQTVPEISGLRNNPMQNYGIVTNQGIDGNIVMKQNINKLVLTFRGNFTYAKNKIVEYDEIGHTYSYQNYTGNSIGQPLLYKSIGLYTPDDFIITTNSTTGAQTYKLKTGLANPNVSVSPGDIKYADLNNDGTIDDYDKTYHNKFHSETPAIVYGFGLNAEYKGLYGGVFFQGVGKASVNLLTQTANFMPFVNGGRDASSARSEVMNRWRVADPYNQDVIYPRMHSSEFKYNERPSTWWYRDASFIRLKNVELGYQFSKNVLRRYQMQNLRLYIQGTNLITWDHLKYWDPELGGANSGAKYPLSRVWTLGLEMTF